MAIKTSTQQQPKQSSLAAAAATAAPSKPEAAKIPPAKKAAIKIANVIVRAVGLEGRFGGYTEEMKTALQNARKWLETAKGLAEKLPADFRPAKRSGGGAVTLAVGSKVTLREKRRETYAGLLSAEEQKAGVEVVSLHGPMVALKTEKGNVFIPKAHLKIAGADAPASA